MKVFSGSCICLVFLLEKKERDRKVHNINVVMSADDSAKKGSSEEEKQSNASATSAEKVTTTDDNPEHLVAQTTDFNSRTDRKCVNIPQTSGKGDRPIIVFKIKKQFFALDARCYHAGGPLEMGDIEEIEERMCIKCPWHRYIIDLSTGVCLATLNILYVHICERQQIEASWTKDHNCCVYMFVFYDPVTKTKASKYTSKGKRQRTHEVIVRGTSIYVKLNKEDRKFESDQYAKPLNNADEGPSISFKTPVKIDSK
ncbi:Rieske (Fe-S) domain containing [Reticulomyxa filosa]|uniref:Rieske (Fe-S) domain containing n=1 Tax=Reticulomyxa filosa TaxID=46433 RepID=X6NU93_RETFI|nr:Rieske (Fe-S) domain containing [Reticulomyxa filosa]|eukprot:ETO29354.1 Rieske (Fe-S) domain containing [Reticulomyxa filosa]